MKKTSKILSLLVALCMTFSMFMGITAMATDLTLEVFDADSDFITLAFNQEVDAENAVIILKKNGEEVADFTFAKNDYHATRVQTVGDGTADDNARYFTYYVTPAEGIEIGAEYKITLHEVNSADGTATFGPWAKTFTVESLAGELTNYRTVGVDAGKVSYDTSVDGQVSANLTVFTTSYSEANNAYIGSQMGADFEGAVPMTNASKTNGLWTEKDVTVKAKIVISGATKENIYFGIADNVNRVGYSSFTGTYMYLQRQSTSMTSAGANYALRHDRGTTSTYAAQAKLDAGNRPTGINYTDLDLKIATKDMVAHSYIENKKVSDINLTEEVKGWAFVSVEAITAASGSSALTVTVSDLYITKATFADATPDVPGVEPEPEPEPEEPANPALILDWDADLDFITLDLAEEIDTLDATLTQAGTQIPVTVSKADHAAMEADNASRCTYMIKPISGGLTRDLPYTLSIANVKGEDDEIKTWSKTFKVEVIAEGLVDDGTNVLDYNSKATVSQVNTDDLQLTWAADAMDRAQIYRAVGNDTDATQGSIDNTSPYTEKDYTVKATFKNLTGATKANLALGSSFSHSDSYSVDHGYYRGVGLNVQVQSTTGKKNGNMQLYATNADGKISETQSAANIEGLEVASDEGVELKISTKNQYARAYVNGGKVADIALPQDIKAPAQIHFKPYSEGASVVIADFIATRAVPVLEDVVEFTAGDATVAEGSIAGKTTVNVSAILNNTTAEAKSLFAVCALYDASDVMKSIAISPVTSAAVGGETEVTFANVAVNGATKAKIFIWDSAAALNPWFPAIIAE